jgi:anti-sigma B factor antagonist
VRITTHLTPESGHPVDHYTTNGWTVLTLTDEVDICTSPAIREAVLRLLTQGHRHFVLDLCRVTFLDSMGLGMTVAITKHIQAHAGSLLFTCADDHILKVFRTGGLRAVYTFRDSVGEATRHAPRGSGLDGWPHRHA